MIIKALRLVVYSNIFIAFCAYCLVIQSFLVSGIDKSWSSPSLWFVFSGTLFIYNFQRLVRFKTLPEQAPEKLKWMHHNRKALKGLTLIALVFSVFLTFKINFETLLILIPPGLIALAYPIKIKSGFRLRNIPFFKVFLIALVWAFVTLLFPLVDEHDYTVLKKGSTHLLFWQRFLFIFAITLPFDIRDLKYDIKDKLKTFPVVFGKSTTKIIAVFSLLLFLGLLLTHLNIYPQTISYSQLTGFFISTIIAAGLIVFSSEKRSEMYYSLVLESTMILQFFLVKYFPLVC